MVAQKEWNGAQYDQLYLNTPNRGVTEPPWPEFMGWSLRMPWIAQRLLEEPYVIDVGCGEVLLAAVLNHLEYPGGYVGIDFSEVQLSRAHALIDSLPLSSLLVAGDVHDADLWRKLPSTGAFVFAEILEHLEHDVDLLQRVPEGRRVILSLPDCDDPSHLRIFPGLDDALRRYQHVLAVEEAETLTLVVDNYPYRWHMISGVCEVAHNRPWSVHF